MKVSHGQQHHLAGAGLVHFLVGTAEDSDLAGTQEAHHDIVEESSHLVVHPVHGHHILHAEVPSLSLHLGIRLAAVAAAAELVGWVAHHRVQLQFPGNWNSVPH